MPIGLVYGNSRGQLRSIVVTDTDAELTGYQVAAGEAMLPIADELYQAMSGPDDLQAHVSSITGLTPAGNRAVLVDGNGYVDSAHIIDIECAIPAFPGLRFVWHDQAQPGWSYINKVFVSSSPTKRRKHIVPNRVRWPLR